MQKVSYMGDGLTTEFSFNFPYFENSDIIVTKNNAATTGYSIVGTSGGQDADIPYIGGKVVFEVAPTISDSITISRSLPLSRVVDYQPTEKINPTILNQDINYVMEILKDFQDELDGFCAQYSDIIDQESIAIVLSRIAAISDAITTVSGQITALGDISTLRQTVSGLVTTTEGHTTSVGNLETQKAGVDMDNLSTTGKNAIATASMPSGNFVQLNVGVSGASYTAPGDGYFCAYAKTNVANGWVMLITPNSGSVNKSLEPVVDNYIGCSIPASSGQSVSLIYTGVTFEYFVFCYANI